MIVQCLLGKLKMLQQADQVKGMWAKRFFCSIKEVRLLPLLFLPRGRISTSHAHGAASFFLGKKGPLLHLLACCLSMCARG